MSFLSWLVVGLLAGWIGSMIVNRRGEGLIMDIVLGVVGAFVGGYLFHLFGHSGVSGINLYSIFVAAIGSMVVLVIYHALVRPRML
ncbi:MAG TPA: GlsB/YeaQ/YmgE family stress response membrane protein [Caulobacteraceae bacterium]